MRFWIAWALLITTQFPALGYETKTDENSGIKQKESVGKKKIDKGKPREFQVDFKFSMEQQDHNRDLIVDEGKTIPGRTVQQIKSTLVLLDSQLIHLGGTCGNVNTSFDIKITSLGNGTIRLAVFAKQSKTESLEAGASRSWNLTLEATKTVKLGKEVKLEFGDEKTIGTKCTFEGVIEEKGHEKK